MWCGAPCREPEHHVYEAETMAPMGLLSQDGLLHLGWLSPLHTLAVYNRDASP